MTPASPIAPLCAGVLVGGRSSRMGRPKHLLELGGRPFLDLVVEAARSVAEDVVLLGAGQVPAGSGALRQLPDPPGLEGPMAGLVAALEHRRDAAWLLVACDMPWLDAAALSWLVSQRARGVIAVQPRTPEGYIQPLCAIYEPSASGFVRTLARAGSGPSRLSSAPGLLLPMVPAEHARAFVSVNTPEELAALGPPG